jgi:serine/threonine protein kinase
VLKRSVSLENYSFVEQIGSGQFSQVYLVHNE